MLSEDTIACAARYKALRSAIVKKDEKFLDLLEEYSDAVGDPATAEEVDTVFDRVIRALA